MKDLKHLIYFEHLLDEAANELVMQAVSEGKHAVGYTCYHMPEVLLNLDNCFSVRMRAPRTGSLEISTYYMTNYLCGYAKALVERGIEGGYNFLSAMLSSETCQMMHRAHEYFDIMGLVKEQNPDFFLSMMDVPFVTTKAAYEHYENQLRKHILEPLEKVCGVDISDKAIRAAIEEHNDICGIISELGELRKLPNPPITSYEFHVLQLVSECCPQYLIKDKLLETLKEVRKRKVDPKPNYRARLVVTGSEVDDPVFTKLLEDCGVYVVADRYCFGSFPSREQIEIKEGETAFDAICRHYLYWNQCARFMDGFKIDQRHAIAAQLVEDFKADGIIYENMKFCEFWSYEKVLANHIFTNEKHIPCCTIEKEYSLGAVGQLRTRFQAFIESLEIKSIQGGK